MKFRKSKDHFNHRFSKPARIGICSAGVILVAVCIAGGVTAASPSDKSEQNQEVTTETEKREGAVSDTDLAAAKQAVSEAQTAYNTAKTAYNKDKTSTSAKQEVSEKGNALLTAKKKLLSVTTDSDDKEKLQNDISTLSTEIGTYKDVAKATPKATAKSTPKAETKKSQADKPAANKKSNQVVANKQTNKGTSNANGSNSRKASVAQNNNAAPKQKACHVVNHPAVTHQEPVYGTRQVQTGTKTVVDHQAWDEQVYAGCVYVCNDCGARLASDSELEAHGIAAHHYAWIGYHLEDVYQTVHHDAVTHQEPVYGTQQYQTGTRTVTDKAAWTETVCN